MISRNFFYFFRYLLCGNYGDQEYNLMGATTRVIVPLGLG